MCVPPGRPGARGAEEIDRGRPAFARHDSAASKLGDEHKRLAQNFPLAIRTRVRAHFADGTGVMGPLRELWRYTAETRLEMTPLLTPEFVLLPGYSGILYAINKFDGKPLYRFPAGPPLTAQVGQYNQFRKRSHGIHCLYRIPGLHGATSFSTYCPGTFCGDSRARPILVKPAVQDDSLYVTPEGAGLYRVNRQYGYTEWRNAKSERYLASNAKFVLCDRCARKTADSGQELGQSPGRL